MNCPECGATSAKLHVLNSRHTTADMMRRRRECIKCKARFTTIEFIIDDDQRTADTSVALVPRDSTIMVVPEGVQFLSPNEHKE